MEIKVERNLETTPGEAFDAWLNPKVKGTPWNMGEKLILQPKVDGLFYWLVHGTPHFGRFKTVKRPGILQHTWMSPYTLGMESTVTVTFKKKGADTVMTLIHSDLPDTKEGKAHIEGWNQFMDAFPQQFKKTVKKGAKKPARG